MIALMIAALGLALTATVYAVKNPLKPGEGFSPERKLAVVAIVPAIVVGVIMIFMAYAKA